MDFEGIMAPKGDKAVTHLNRKTPNEERRSRSPAFRKSAVRND
jgi:hypothetical protein